MPGITSYGAYIPQTRLPLSLASGRPAKEGGPERAVANYDEDAVTMAVSAAIDCLTGFERSSVDALLFASTTYPLREKQGAALIAKTEGDPVLATMAPCENPPPSAPDPPPPAPPSSRPPV